MIERLTKKVFVLLALLIVLFQSFSLPIYASATSNRGKEIHGRVIRGKEALGILNNSNGKGILGRKINTGK
jgi:hypothetical protein